jgi:hypothetical protein
VRVLHQVHARLGRELLERRLEFGGHSSNRRRPRETRSSAKHP